MHRSKLIPRYAAALVCLLCCITSARGQQPSASAMSSDPREWMLAATRLNNLTTPDTKPWHMKATYRSLDESGSVTDEGTFEEWWSGPHKSKIVLTAKDSTETEYTTNKGDFRISSQQDIPSALGTIRAHMINPLPPEEIIGVSNYSAKTIENGTVKLTCLTVIGEASTYCLGATEPILRIYVAPPDTKILFNRVLRFAGKTVAGDVKVTRYKASFNVHVDVIEALDTTGEAGLAPRPGQALVPIPHIVDVSAGVAEGMLQYKVMPDYPLEARHANISGTVVVSAIIGKDGHLRNLKIVSGPTALQYAATQALQKWRYRPYLLDGEPLEVETTINVIFAR